MSDSGDYHQHHPQRSPIKTKYLLKATFAVLFSLSNLLIFDCIFSSNKRHFTFMLDFLNSLASQFLSALKNTFRFSNLELFPVEHDKIPQVLKACST
jgi:hypothetical protein